MEEQERKKLIAHKQVTSIKPHQTLLTSKEADVLEKSTVPKSESEETKNMMLSFKISAGLSFTLFYFCS